VLRKRSVSLSGHATSIALEPEFWTEVERLAAEAQMPLSAYVALIDQGRAGGNLASALRLAVLRALRPGVSPLSANGLTAGE
jgi:predicted DNA-binding ribbon-helix-helix protein